MGVMVKGKDGKMHFMGGAAEALSGLLTPRRKKIVAKGARRPTCGGCQRTVHRGMIETCTDPHCLRAR